MNKIHVADRPIHLPRPHPSDFFRRNCLNKTNNSHQMIADRLGVSLEYFTGFLNGNIDLDAEFAIRLNKGTGFSTETWMHLQSNYSLYIASQKSTIASSIYEQARSN